MSRVVERLMVDRVSIVFPIRCINRWPAVMLAVSRTARAIGWISRLMVSIITSMGIRGVGVPCGSKRRPVMIVPAHRGIAMARFIESWVVGVNE